MQPNFLFLFPDQLRGDWMPYSDELRKQMGVEDLHLRMPNISRLMENGTTFASCITPSPLCVPARACLASGRHYRYCRLVDNLANYDPHLRTFYSILKENGYSVGGVGKLDLNKAELDWGKDGWWPELAQIGFTHALDSEGKMDAVQSYARELDHGPYLSFLEKNGWDQKHIQDMRERRNTDKVTPLPDEFYSDNWVSQNGIDMIGSFPKDRPWFLQVNFTGPHNPWDVTRRMKDGWENETMPAPAMWSGTADINGIRQNYAAMIENIDRNCGLLIDAVKARGELENTIIVFAADHGELLGDHGRFNKSRPERGSIHIPMVIDASHFGGQKGAVNTSPVELQDIASTFLDYAGLAFDVPCESVSMKPIVDGTAEKIRDFHTSQLIINSKMLPDAFGVVDDGRYKLTMWTSGERSLFDLKEDPFECHNIMETHPEIAAELERKFEERNPPHVYKHSVTYL